MIATTAVFALAWKILFKNHGFSRQCEYGNWWRWWCWHDYEKPHADDANIYEDDFYENDNDDEDDAAADNEDDAKDDNADDDVDDDANDYDDD